VRADFDRFPSDQGRCREGHRDTRAGASAGIADLPTAQEQGLADLDCSTWSAFVSPKGTPEVVVRRLAQATNEVVEMPLVRERFASVGVTVAPPERRSPEYLGQFHAARAREVGRPHQGERRFDGLGDPHGATRPHGLRWCIIIDWRRRLQNFLPL